MKVYWHLGWKFVLASTLVLVISSLFTGFYLAGALRSANEADQEQSLRRETQLAAQLLEVLPMSVVQEQGDSLARQAASGGEARFTILDGTGKVLGDSAEPAAMLENHADRPEVQQALRGEVGIYRRYSTTLGLSMLYVAVPIPDLPPVELVVRASISGNFNENYLMTLLRALLIAVGGGFLISLLLVPWASLLVTRPLKRMLKGIQPPSPGAPYPLLRMSRTDELGDLAKGIDRLLEQVNTREENLRSLQERIGVYQDKESDGLLVFDAEDRVRSASPKAEELLGVPLRRMIGRTLLECTLDHALAELAHLALSGASGVPVSFAGRELFLRGRRLAQSSPDFGLLWIEDRSELAALKATRRDFVANVSHELRTPIASLRAILETLGQQPPPSSERQSEFLARSLKEVEYLQALLEALAKLSRLETGKVDFQMTDCDLRRLLVELEAGLAERARQRSLTLEFRTGEEQICVRADPLFLREALLAILDNAIKFSYPGVAITVSASNKEGWVTLEFRDHGPGIPALEVPRIFERFYKVDKGRAGEGFGIGLSLARHILESFRGSLTAFSDLGKGALFVVRLPLAPGNCSGEGRSSPRQDDSPR
ncbi:MAG: ATP-binding protein [bacterium]